MRCPSCGFDNPPSMRFCGSCGVSLPSSPSSVEQRKFVTVVFVDIVDSTHMLNVLDPEQVRAQMSRFFSVAQEEVHRFGGTVDKFLGDAVMAIFGLPTIHEDDPERAARAALAIIARTRAGIASRELPEIRIGINTGEVIANAPSTGTGEFLVTGEAVNLAARLQQHATPGQILVGERTTEMLRRVAQLRPVAPFRVKGMADPVAASELVAISPARERGLRTTPFVDREDDLGLLRGLLRRARRERRGHVITLLGPAGVGKSRLVHEFRTQLEEDVRILRGRALPYGAGIPYWPLAEGIREACGLLRTDPLEAARRKVRVAAGALGVAETIPALLFVLGIGGDGQELSREALFGGMRMFFQAVAQRDLTMLIMDDIHSAEDVTLDYLEHTADWVRDTPLLLLILARPELLERRPAWMGGKRNATTLFLHPLASEESRALVQGILGAGPAPDPLLDLVLDRAEGNPLFMEEMVWGLIERRVLAKERSGWALTVPLPQLSVPDTVHAVIAARIDALPSSEKQVLQNAAVAGKEFWPGALQAIGDEDVQDAIRALVAKDMLIYKPRSTLLGAEELTFRHILIRDVAYAMIPKSLRWAKHARFAAWVEEMAGDRRAEYADIIAHHWVQVVRLQQELGLPPDPRARTQAVENLLRAADRGASLYANFTALEQYSQVLDLEPGRPARVRAFLGRGEVRMLLGQHERAREDFVAARDLAREAGDPRVEAVALDHLGVSFRRQDRIAEGLAHLEAALTLSRQLGDSALTGGILNHIGFTYFSDGRHAEAIRAHDEARSLLEAGRNPAGLAESFHGLGDNLFLQGRFQESLRWLVESARVSDEIGNRSLAAENRLVIAWIRRILGDYAEAQAEVHRSLASLTEIGDIGNTAVALPVRAAVEATLGLFGSALEHATEGLNLARQIKALRYAVYNLLWIGVVRRELEAYAGAWQVDREAADLTKSSRAEAFWVPVVLASLALDAAGLGQAEEARAHVEEASRLLDRGFKRLDFAEEVTYARGCVLLALGDASTARDVAAHLSKMTAESGHRYWEVPATLLRADALAALGDPAAAAAVYRAGAEKAAADRRLPMHWRLLAGLAEAERAMGQTPASEATAARATEIIQRLAATAPDEQLRASFLGSVKVRRTFAIAPR